MSAESEVKKTNWKFLGQLLGALGVILSLIFVAWEIRQNTEAVENATIQSISEQSFTATNLIVQNEDLRIVFNMALDGRELSEDQETLINSFYQSALRVQMNRFLQTVAALTFTKHLNFPFIRPKEEIPTEQTLLNIWRIL
jgi:hypothetical protein